jgi:hypothetical protein
MSSFSFVLLYNTLVYETVSGRSMCPHEEGTVPREQIELVYEGGIKSQTLQATSGARRCRGHPAQQVAHQGEVTNRK